MCQFGGLDLFTISYIYAYLVFIVALCVRERGLLRYVHKNLIMHVSTILSENFINDDYDVDDDGHNDNDDYLGMMYY